MKEKEVELLTERLNQSVSDINGIIDLLYKKYNVETILYYEHNNGTGKSSQLKTLRITQIVDYLK